MTLRTMLMGLIVALICCATSLAAPAVDVEDCLRDGGARYADPGAAVDDQYSDAVGACDRALDGSGVQVTVSGTGGSDDGTPPSGSSPIGPSPSRPGSAGGDGVSAQAPAQPAPAPASSRAADVKAALVRADAGSAVAGPAAVTGSPGWLLVLGGLLVVGIGAGVTARAYRSR